MNYREKLIIDFWSYFDVGNIDKASELLHAKFKAIWKTSNEIFPNKMSFMEMNKSYPGKWHTKLERVNLTNNGAISIVHVFSKCKDDEPEFYTTTFYEFKNKLIYTMTEYWATCEQAPEWRKKYTQN